MKKAGMVGNTGKGRKANTGASVVYDVGAKGQKRGRPAKATPETYDVEEEHGEGEEENQESKVMPKPGHDGHGEDETPLKKTKFGDNVDSEAAKTMLTSNRKK
jgi:hypothetical protein